MPQPTKLSPLHTLAQADNAQFQMTDGWQTVAAFRDAKAETAVARQSVALCDQSHHGKIRIEGETAAPFLNAADLRVNEGKETAQGHLYCLRPDLFFLHTDAATVRETAVALTEQAAAQESLITVTDVTHGSAEIRLIGPRSAELLSRLCGLDFHDSQFPHQTAKQSSVAKTGQLIIRRDQGDLPAYALIGPRSLAAYLWQTTLQAGADLNAQPIGQESFSALRNP